MDARPPYFYLKKYFIMTVTIIQIILMVILAILAGVAIAAVGTLPPSEKDKGLAIGMLVFGLVVFILSALISMLGLFGAWKEHFCMSCTYAVLSTISTVLNFVSAISSPISWLSFVISLLVSIAAILFTIDLRRIANGTVQPAY